MTDKDRTATLSAVAKAGNGPVDLIETGFALARWRNKGTDLAWHRSHIKTLADDLAGRLGPQIHVAEAAEALAATMAQTFGYIGDSETYDDLQNADLIRVIDRRKGLPVALGILYMAVARAQGWQANGLAFPGHFMIVLQVGSGRVILDPFHGGLARGPADLRAMIKGVLGPEGELAPAHYAAVPDARVLLRLCDNMRVRLADGGRWREAQDVVYDMLLMAPGAPWLMRELAIISAKVGQINKAVETLTALLADPGLDSHARHDAASLLEKVRAQLN